MGENRVKFSQIQSKKDLTWEGWTWPPGIRVRPFMSFG